MNLEICRYQNASTDSAEEAFAIFQREILGIKGFGGGALKFAARDVGLFKVFPNLNTIPIEKPLKSLMNREIGYGDLELQKEDRRAIDDVVFDALNLNNDERKRIYKSVCDLLNLRNKKSKTKKKI